MYPVKCNMVNIYIHSNIVKNKENNNFLWLQPKFHLRNMGIEMGILLYLSSALYCKDLCCLGPSSCSSAELTTVRVVSKDTRRNEWEMSCENSSLESEKKPTEVQQRLNIFSICR